MSALPQKADIGSTCQDVRFVPKADIAKLTVLLRLLLRLLDLPKLEERGGSMLASRNLPRGPIWIFSFFRR